VGTVTDSSGVPLANQQVKVAVFASATDDGAVALCASKPVVTDKFGQFSAPLPSCDAVIHAQADLWTEVTVGKTGATVLPRQRITPAAYALEAGAAASATGALAATLASFVSQIADLTKKVGDALLPSDVAPMQSEIDALAADVAKLKAAPKAIALEVALTFGSGTMVETPAGTLVGQFSLWLSPQSQYAAIEPVFKIDGQKVGTSYAPEIFGNIAYFYSRQVFVNIAVPIAAGKHFFELNNAKSGSWACAGTVGGICPAVFTVLP
jgi:hypothetical protein